ncbi:Protein of unknown function (DUF3040) [Isoptericola sp. CG 20/1183]|uniref:DUF3040 domain-containing protein n=1 Tax=Isoptericola halotolerans TaxID=300560 RepID=A0ABX5EFD5_9MICO|nr:MULTISPECIES: DUF3040 domain-containing protein [Isoptericola]MCK0116621.1 DUF3040 domain-containing protein [Isoptericola sp. S6320L]PRZ05588.1 Protein of unknown function (DUF3040) [Isoptericola halotolerans]PRZ06156.1 Protein of unknown function (DUF3040) [Isoptericola sp. CG 20/1183]
MPLSEYEQRVLEQMERALESDDPRLATTLQRSRHRSPLRYVLAGLCVVLGLVLLVIGVASSLTLLGVAGFVLMFAGVVYAFSAPRKKGPQGVVNADGTVGPSSAAHAGSGGHRGRTAAPSKGPGFLARLEERWDRRREQGR